jgi:hypothetical protein
MKRLLKPFRATPPTKPAATNRRPTFRPQLEQLDQRLVPSLSSAISIQHHTSFSDWTERDWFAVDQGTGVIVEYQGTSGHVINASDSIYHLKYLALSATIDPYTGKGALFALELAPGDTVPFLVWYGSAGGSGGAWSWQYQAMSATRDSHVYGVTPGGSDVVYSGVPTNTQPFTDLGAPHTSSGSGVLAGTSSLAASVGLFGGNEVFAIGQDGYIYVNSSNTYGDWRLVDNKAQFASLSATPNDTVFALTVGLPEIGRGGLIYQETEQYNIRTYRYYWASQYIAGGSYYTSISADTDGLGHDEVYAIDVGRNAWLYNAYNSAKWTIKDSDVFDLAAAGGGYFYDVNYYYSSGLFLAYQWNPDAGIWTYLDSGLV